MQNTLIDAGPIIALFNKNEVKLTSTWPVG